MHTGNCTRWDKQSKSKYGVIIQGGIAGKNANDGNLCIMKLRFLSINLTSNVIIKENQEKLPTLYWLPKVHKRPYKARFIANSSSCTTTELSKRLNSWLTAIKNHLIKYDGTVYEREGKITFGQ